jgi:hypothetical protein
MLGNDVDSVEVAPARIEELRMEMVAARQEIAAAEMEATRLEAVAREAERAIAKRLEAERAKVEAYYAKLVQARRAEAAAAGEAESAAVAARTAKDTLTKQTAALQISIEAEAKAATAAEVELARLDSQRSSAAQLPAMQTKRRTFEGRVEQLESSCTQLSRALEPVRAEVAALTCVGGSSRVEVLEARVARLESECSQLQDSINSEDAAKEASADAAAAIAEEAAAAAVKQQKDENLMLISKLKVARSGAKLPLWQLSNLQAEVATAREKCETIRSHHEHVRYQLHGAEEDNRRETAQVAQRQASVDALNQDVQVAEQVAIEKKEKRQKLDKKTRELVLARRKAEQNEDLLGWRLQKTVELLDVEKRNDPFIKCLQSSALGGVGMLFNKQRAAAKSVKYLGGRRGLKLGDAPSDGETSTTGVDPDMSIAGDESVSDFGAVSVCEH